MVFVAFATMAQETYENARISTEDLNGTARYVGMGGALDALGADISTIGSNPAGIGLFRHSTARVSMGFVSQQDAKDVVNADKTNASFDQVGFVYSQRTGRSSFINFAFNYHKSANFNQILSASDKLNGSSQNKLSYLKGAGGLFDVVTDADGILVGSNNMFNSLDYLYYNAFLTTHDDEGIPSYGYNNANGYNFTRVNSGYIGEYDFNISGNLNDRVYLGLTVGIHDVNYKGYSLYSESLVSGEDSPIGSLAVADERNITGTGFNVKAGVIFRPIESSPFRIGLSVASPTWYDLTTKNYTVLRNGTSMGEYDKGTNSEIYDFKLYTPWKFGLSVGTTFGRSLAIGAGYDYADYGSLDSRVNTGGGYDWYYDTYYESSSSDNAMNSHTKSTLKGVSTFKAGVELKPEPEWAVRLGYNYVSPMYSKNGYKDFGIDSPGSYYSSATDYTNWKATNRITCGAGYSKNGFSLDLAYQYTVTDGDFKPFTDYAVSTSVGQETNFSDYAKVSNKRHQLLLTLGYTF